MPGVPWVLLDAQYVGGAWACAGRYYGYLDSYYTRRGATAGESPVAIEGTFRTAADTCVMRATYTLVDAAPLGSVQATLFLYEDDITWCCGYQQVDHWDQIVRYMASEPVTLEDQGDERVVARQIAIPSGWDSAHLHAVAILENVSGQKSVIQAARLDPKDFALDLPRRVRSVPDANGAATFDGVLRNVGSAPDLLTVSLDTGFGWAAEFQIEGDPGWYTSRTVPLGPGSALDLTVRVRTDGDRRIGSGGLTVISGNSGRSLSDTLRVYNGSSAILLVDDDQGGDNQGVPYETPFLHAFDSLGYLYQDWDIHFGHADFSPDAADMAGFDAVIWETGAASPDPLRQTDVRFLEQYLDAQGSLYLDGMDFLTGQSPNAFTSGYLGLGSWTNNTRCHTASGAGGDPISDGMVLPLSFPSDNENKVDTTVPRTDAHAIFFSEHTPPHPNAVRFESGGFRVVFSTIPQQAISESAPAPNNNRTVIRRVVDWLTRRSSSGAPVLSPSAARTVLEVWPNPCATRTDVLFRVASPSLPARLVLLDVSGRAVRRFADPGPTPGSRIIRWDGTDEAGRPLASGVYLAQLRSGGETCLRKLVLVGPAVSR